MRETKKNVDKFLSQIEARITRGHTEDRGNVVYGVAVVKNECCGHGDYRDVRVIEPVWSTGNFPPVFTSRAEAVRYAGRDQVVVKLQLK